MRPVLSAMWALLVLFAVLDCRLCAPLVLGTALDHGATFAEQAVGGDGSGGGGDGDSGGGSVAAQKINAVRARPATSPQSVELGGGGSDGAAGGTSVVKAAGLVGGGAGGASDGSYTSVVTSASTSSSSSGTTSMNIPVISIDSVAQTPRTTPLPAGRAVTFGFERGSAGAFGINVGGGGSAELRVNSGAAAHRGRYGAEVIVSSKAARARDVQLRSGALALSNGTSYLVSLWGRSAPAGQPAVLSLVEAATGGWVLRQPVRLAGVWQRVALDEFIPDDDGLYYITVEVGTALGTLFFDDVEAIGMSLEDAAATAAAAAAAAAAPAAAPLEIEVWPAPAEAPAGNRSEEEATPSPALRAGPAPAPLSSLIDDDEEEELVKDNKDKDKEEKDRKPSPPQRKQEHAAAKDSDSSASKDIKSSGVSGSSSSNSEEGSSKGSKKATGKDAGSKKIGSGSSSNKNTTTATAKGARGDDKGGQQRPDLPPGPIDLQGSGFLDEVESALDEIGA